MLPPDAEKYIPFPYSLIPQAAKMLKGGGETKKAPAPKAPKAPKKEEPAMSEPAEKRDNVRQLRIPASVAERLKLREPQTFKEKAKMVAPYVAAGVGLGALALFGIQRFRR